MVEDLESMTEDDYFNMTDKERMVQEKKLAKLPGWKLEEVFHYLNNKRLKPLFSR